MQQEFHKKTATNYKGKQKRNEDFEIKKIDNYVVAVGSVENRKMNVNRITG